MRNTQKVGNVEYKLRKLQSTETELVDQILDHRAKLEDTREAIERADSDLKELQKKQRKLAN